MAASKLIVWNRALQILGQKRVDSTDNPSTVGGRSCMACSDTCLEKELEKHSWNFAIKRAQLAAAAPAPTFGRANSFPLPNDCLRLIKPYPEQNGLFIDYVIEGQSILTNLGSPLNVRYVALITDVNAMTALFREVWAHSMAVAMCEELTQSRTKKIDAIEEYQRHIADARRKNAFETVAQVPPEDDWVTVRGGINNFGPFRPYSGS